MKNANSFPDVQANVYFAARITRSADLRVNVRFGNYAYFTKKTNEN